VALFSAAAGLLYGAWVDGVSAWLLAAGLGTFLAALAAGLSWLSRRNDRQAMAAAH
jgi:hypothetical protein